MTVALDNYILATTFRRTVFTDPEGRTMGLWKAKQR